MKAISLSALLLSLVVPACSLSTDPDDAGTFNATITGAVESTMQGVALFGTVSTGDFSLVMTDPNDNQGIAIGQTSGRPGTGTHPIGRFDSETGLIGAYARDGEPVGEFRSEEGAFDITSSSPTQLVGSLTFDAIGTLDSDPDNEVSITVVATFDARCVQTGGSECF